MLHWSIKGWSIVLTLDMAPRPRPSVPYPDLRLSLKTNTDFCRRSANYAGFGNMTSAMVSRSTGPKRSPTSTSVIPACFCPERK
jgi:hypothetical protein